MYQKRTQNQTAEQYPSYSVLKAVLEYEERAAFVERARSSATGCRFGSDRDSRGNADINPQIELATFCDPLDEDIVPFYACALKRGEDGVLVKVGITTPLNTTNRSGSGCLASNRGRGSPGISGTIRAGASPPS